MKALIVYAHPEPTSFNGALKDRAVACLEQFPRSDSRLENGTLAPDFATI